MSFFCVINSDKFKKFAINGLIFCAVLIVFCVTIFAGGIKSTSTASELKPIYKGNEQNKNVSLMINVYWGDDYIEPMLNALKEENAKATFFIGGSWVKSNPELFKKIVSEGHEIGNHGYLHKDCAKISEEKIREEITKTNAIIKEFGGGDCTLFAPPSGSFNQTTLKVAEELKMKTIMWSKDTIDWRDKDSKLVLERASKNLQNGDLILMHPTSHTSKAFPQILKEAKKAGFSLVCVSENIKSN